jgi:signal transduction histidine kinase
MSTFKLEPNAPQDRPLLTPGWEGLGEPILLYNARWFAQIRWAVVAVLATFSALSSAIPAALRSLGLAPQGTWPWLVTGILAFLNLVVIVFLRRLDTKTPRGIVVANLWLQIILDMVVLTVLVHLVGSTQTVIAFAYLLHITLACVFFTRRHSAGVLLLSSVLFLSVLALEASGILPARSVLSRPATPLDLHSLVAFAVPSLFIWGVVWYLVSTIAQTVRRRDQELDEANRRLLQADEDKNRQVLHVTHDLKAPFSGIESNIQVLRATYWDELPEAVRNIIGKIEARGHTLRSRIGDILTLGDLRSSAGAKPSLEEVPLHPLLSALVQESQGLASLRNVTIRLAPEAAVVKSDPRQLRALFANLISNAISYSRDGGTVDVAILPGSPPRIKVADRGIGISAEAMPHIFEDYFRTKEAAQHNTQSTGLGLAIVNQVAKNLQLTVVVDSEPGRGTTFEVSIPD